MQAGTLNSRIGVQHKATAQDEYGQPVTGWEPVADVWADVRMLSGMETVRSGIDVSVVKASARVRTRPDLVAGMRCLIDGHLFSVNAVLRHDDEHMDLILTEAS